MRFIGNSIVVIIIAFAVTAGFYRYMPLAWFETTAKPLFGSTITTILGTDTLSSSRTVINTNFSNLNTDKLQSGSTAGALIIGTTTIGQLTATGTVTFASAIGIASGGTNATSFGTANGILAYDGTREVNFSGYTITSSLMSLVNASTTNLTASQSFFVASKQISGERYPVWGYASSTAWVGTTTVHLLSPFNNGTLSKMTCVTDVGTLNAQFYDNTTAMSPMFNASTTKGTVTFTANNTFSKGDDLKVDFGTPATAPTTITCTGVASGY